MYGILRFNLVELKPYFKLYVAPISIDPRKPWFPISYPEGYAKELAHDLGLFATRGMPFDTWALNEGRLSEDAFIEHAADLYQEQLRLMEHELSRCERGVFYCYFEYPDIIQHMYWRFIDPEHPLYDPNAPPRLKGMIDDCYRKMDAVVGVALAGMRTGDTLIVLSDHGFTTFRRAAHIDSWLRENGYLVLKDPTATAGGPLFADVDWSATRAYALGYGGIYINTVGREPQGIVAEGPGKEALKSEIADKLRKWIDPKTGTPVARTRVPEPGHLQGPGRAPGARHLHRLLRRLRRLVADRARRLAGGPPGRGQPEEVERQPPGGPAARPRRPLHQPPDQAGEPDALRPRADRPASSSASTTCASPTRTSTASRCSDLLASGRTCRHCAPSLYGIRVWVYTRCFQEAAALKQDQDPNVASGREPEEALDFSHASVPLAKQFIAAGELRKARLMLEQLVEQAPDAEALVTLATLEIDNPKRQPDALDHLKRALELAPQHTEAWLLLANYWGLKGQADKQRRCLEKILTYDKANRDARDAVELLVTRK